MTFKGIPFQNGDQQSDKHVRKPFALYIARITLFPYRFFCLFSEEYSQNTSKTAKYIIS